MEDEGIDRDFGVSLFVFCIFQSIFETLSYYFSFK